MMWSLVFVVLCLGIAVMGAIWHRLTPASRVVSSAGVVLSALVLLGGVLV